MSDHAHTRLVVVRNLKPGETVPADGRVYREVDGKLSFAIRYTPDQQARHRWLLSRIESFDRWRAIK